MTSGPQNATGGGRTVRGMAGCHKIIVTNMVKGWRARWRWGGGLGCAAQTAAAQPGQLV